MTSINTNISAVVAESSLSRVNSQYSTSMNRLSSGLRINAAKDDAAGMAIAEKMTSQIKGLNQAVRNSVDAKALMDTTEGAHVEVSNMLQRLRELAIQAGNDTNTASDRGALVAEGQQLIGEINRVATTTTFNGMNILDGSFSGKQFQIGADAGQVMTIDVDSAKATDIGAFTVRTKTTLTEGTSGTLGIQAGTTLDVTGFAGSASLTTTAAQSAKSLAAALNSNSASTGVSATASTHAKISDLSAATTVTFEINGVSIGDVNIADTGDLRGIRDAINTVAGQTGVTATLGGSNGEILLRDNSGENIEITAFDSGDNTATLRVTAQNADLSAAGATAGTHYTDLTEGTADRLQTTIVGQTEITSTKSFSIGSSSTTAGNSFFEATNNSSELEAVSAIDLSTAESASRAINVVDVALQKISQTRANLGAASNRLDSTISNLTNISVNVQAARSNVQDADFAKESSDLARGQIMSAAATAMLAQANNAPRSILSLLRG